MLIPGERKGRRRRGGRKTYGSAFRDPVRHHIVLNDQVYAIIESERKPDETNNECLLRLFTEKTKEIERYRKKVDALECRLEQFQEPSTETIHEEIVRNEV